MNIKLFASLSVAIAFVSALTFIHLYQESSHASSKRITAVNTIVDTSSGTIPSLENITEGSMNAKIGVKIGDPSDVKASVKILKEK